MPSPGARRGFDAFEIATLRAEASYGQHGDGGNDPRHRLDSGNALCCPYSLGSIVPPSASRWSPWMWIARSCCFRARTSRPPTAFPRSSRWSWSRWLIRRQTPRPLVRCRSAIACQRGESGVDGFMGAGLGAGAGIDSSRTKSPRRSSTQVGGDPQRGSLVYLPRLHA